MSVNTTLEYLKKTAKSKGYSVYKNSIGSPILKYDETDIATKGPYDYTQKKITWVCIGCGKRWISKADAFNCKKLGHPNSQRFGIFVNKPIEIVDMKTFFEL